MRCFIEIFNETKETAKTFGGALSDLVSLLVFLNFLDANLFYLCPELFPLIETLPLIVKG
jgi:hypothetical protein